MARNRNNNADLIAIIIFILTSLVFAYRFLISVNRYKKWNEFIISTGIFALINFCSYYLEQFIGHNFFLISLGVTFTGYCAYWYNEFSFADTRLNASLWQERQWWWTLDGWQFEQEVARVFRLHGYKATVTKGSGDGGIDIILKKDGKTFIVQCKHYQNPLGPEPVRALWGCKDDFNADKVIMVASSGLTQASSEFVNNKENYLVLNLDDVIRMAKLASQ